MKNDPVDVRVFPSAVPAAGAAAQTKGDACSSRVGSIREAETALCLPGPGWQGIVEVTLEVKVKWTRQMLSYRYFLWPPGLKNSNPPQETELNWEYFLKGHEIELDQLSQVSSVFYKVDF